MFQGNSGFFSQMPVVTKNLIIINVLVWFSSITLARVIDVDMYRYLGLHFVVGGNFSPHQLITYMFMHDSQSPSHLFFNMFSVWMFGRTLESVWGAKRFLIFYFVTGIGAGLIQELAWLFEYRQLVFSDMQFVNVIGEGVLPIADFLGQLNTVGASGAVFGLLMAFGMLFPNAELFIMFIPVPIKAKYFVFIYGLIELVGGVSQFSFDNVAHFAHLGGMLFGYFLIVYWRRKGYGRGPIYF